MGLPKYCSTCGNPLKQEIRDDRERLVCGSDSCDYVFWNNPTPVLAAIVQQGSNVILVQSIGWQKHWYALVTGFMEANETAEDGIMREVQEEIGLTPISINFVGLYSFFRMNQLLIAYHVEVPEGEVQLQTSELSDYKIIPIEAVQPWNAGTGEAIRDWLRTKGYERELLPLDAIK